MKGAFFYLVTLGFWITAFVIYDGYNYGLTDWPFILACLGAVTLGIASNDSMSRIDGAR